MQLSRERIRIKFDQQSERGAKDTITGNNPTAWRGTDMQFELLFSVTIGDGEDAVNNVLDISNFATVELTVKDAADRGGPTLMQRAIGADQLHFNVAAKDWDSGSDQHCIITFSAAETRLEMGNLTTKTFFLVVRVTTNDGNTFTLGFADFKLLSDGISGEATTPAMGGTIIPLGQTYSGAGAFVLNVVQNNVYYYFKGANDTDLVNGTETLNATGYFTAQGGTVTLHGTNSTLITALVRWPLFPTWEQVNALVAGMLKAVNAPGMLLGLVSPDGTKMRLLGVGNDGLPVDEPRDLS